MTVGPLLREWRVRRRLSQLELALDGGVSTRHVSFVETGRARPSAEMIVTLAERLDVPLRERNQLLLAGGFAPRYGELDLEDPALAPVKEAVDLVLAGHEPYPAIAVDRQWALLAGNAAISVFTDGVAPHLLGPPVNTIRLALHPEGVAPRIRNLGVYRAHLLERLEREQATTGDPGLATLIDEMRAYPAPPPDAPAGNDIVVPLEVDTVDGVPLSFFSTVAVFGTAVDITVAELSIESFFAADAATAAYMRDR